jgi:hypothetical protein
MMISFLYTNKLQGKDNDSSKGNSSTNKRVSFNSKEGDYNPKNKSKQSYSSNTKKVPITRQIKIEIKVQIISQEVATTISIIKKINNKILIIKRILKI